ncbi:MAG: hypothetical protein WC911_01870 [Thermoleophilia bacterium]
MNDSEATNLLRALAPVGGSPGGFDPKKRRVLVMRLHRYLVEDGGYIPAWLKNEAAEMRKGVILYVELHKAAQLGLFGGQGREFRPEVPKPHGGGKPRGPQQTGMTSGGLFGTVWVKDHDRVVNGHVEHVDGHERKVVGNVHAPTLTGKEEGGRVESEPSPKEESMTRHPDAPEGFEPVDMSIHGAHKAPSNEKGQQGSFNYWYPTLESARAGQKHHEEQQRVKGDMKRAREHEKIARGSAKFIEAETQRRAKLAAAEIRRTAVPFVHPSIYEYRDYIREQGGFVEDGGWKVPAAAHAAITEHIEERNRKLAIKRQTKPSVTPPVPAALKYIPIQHSNTYDYREDIKKAGGRWDNNQRVWMVPENRHAELIAKMTPAPAPPPAAPLPTIAPGEKEYTRFENGSRRMKPAHPLAVGDVVFRGDGANRTYQTVTKVRPSLFRSENDQEDFGETGRGAGWYHPYTVRPATEEESANLRGKHAEADAKVKAATAAKMALQSAIQTAEYPKKAEPSGESIKIGQNETIQVEPDLQHAWHIKYNGRDGDNWAYNNLGGHSIAHRFPMTPELSGHIEALKV